MNARWLITALGATLGASCSEPAIGSGTQLNLDRPVDIAFACYGDMRVITTFDANGLPMPLETDFIGPTAQPAISCETRSPQIAPPSGVELQPPPGQGPIGSSVVNDPSWYGFILQSASGTVALATWPSKPSYDPAGANKFGGTDVTVLDADPLTPGKNAISIGEDPVAIATDTSGCYEVTANAGSCDLSMLEINSALDDKPSVRVDRLPVTRRNDDQILAPILARPAAMVAAPNTTDVGKVCPMAATGVVYVAYPSCHLVAAVDMSDGMAGRIVAGIKYDGDVPHLMTDTELDTLTCPAECPNAMGMLDRVMPGVRPVALDLEVTLDRSSGTGAITNRLVIGGDNAASITVVELDPTTSLPLPQAPTQIALEDTTGKLGVTEVALSPQIAMGGTERNNDTDPTPPGGFGQYVYAVATDNTVRVVDVLTVNQECDTQVDARFVRSPVSGTPFPITRLQCFPVGDPATPPRRVGARGPGIELVGNAVPTSVAIIKGLDAKLPDTLTTPSTLIGHFAMITAANGETFVVNIDDDFAPDVFDDGNPLDPDDPAPLNTMPALVMAHQLRDAFTKRGAKAGIPDMDDPNVLAPQLCKPIDPELVFGGPTGGGPRATSAPVPIVTGGPISTAKVPELPALRQIKCVSDGTGGDAPLPRGIAISEMQFGAPVSVRDQVFPDLRSLASEEAWSLTWEGTLSLDSSAAVDGPLIRTGQMLVDSNGMHLSEQSRPFCAMGVEPFDAVHLRGCNVSSGDADCPAGYQCFVHPDSQVSIGACMLQNEASRLADACRDFLISPRRYTVGPAPRSGELLLLPRKHVLRTTPLDGCTDDTQCEQLADYAVQNGSPNLVDIGPDLHTWACMPDNARAPINADPAKNKRCVQTCGLTENIEDLCDANTICQGATATTRGICMEGVTPPQACVNGPQRFDVRASEAFAVIGTRSGYIHPIIDQGGTCVASAPDPLASPVQRGRIPLRAPACGDPTTTDPITGKLLGGGFEPNPCALTVQHFEDRPNYIPGTCQLGDPQTTLEPRVAPAIKFRGPGLTLTLVDPYYPGDGSCVRDRQGMFIDDQIPLVFPGYTLTFGQKAGFTPLTLPAIDPAFPVKVVRGPTDSIWVIDNGDSLSNSFEPSTRGQVFRLESTQLNVINQLN
jgi:hypothetical protein